MNGEVESFRGKGRMTEVIIDKPQERFQIVLKSDKYRERISQMALNGSTSLVIDFEDILVADSRLAEGLLENPDEYLEYGNNAAFDQLQIQDPEYAEKVREQGITVRIRAVSYTHLTLPTICSV